MKFFFKNIAFLYLMGLSLMFILIIAWRTSNDRLYIFGFNILAFFYLLAIIFSSKEVRSKLLSQLGSFSLGVGAIIILIYLMGGNEILIHIDNFWTFK